MDLRIATEQISGEQIKETVLMRGKGRVPGRKKARRKKASSLWFLHDMEGGAL